MKKILTFVMLIMLSMLMAHTTLYAQDDIIDGPDVIHKAATQLLSLSNIMSLYDLDVMVIKDEYTGFGSEPGIHTITIQQGENIKTIDIVVIEGWSKLENSEDLLLVADYKNIYVSENRVLLMYEIVNYIYAVTGYVDISTTPYYKSYINEYHDSIDEDTDLVPVGDYLLSFKLSYTSGYESEYSAIIHVIEFKTIDGDALVAPKSGLEKLMSNWWLILLVSGVGYFGYKFIKKGKSVL